MIPYAILQQLLLNKEKHGYYRGTLVSDGFDMHDFVINAPLSNRIAALLRNSKSGGTLL